MCPLKDEIMSNSYGPLGASPVCCQTVSNFFSLFFLLATTEGPGVSTNISSEGRLSGICRDLPTVVDCLRLTNFIALFACSIFLPPLPVRPEDDTSKTFLSSVHKKTYALKCHSNPGYIKVNLLLLLTKNHVTQTVPAVPWCIKIIKHPMGRCGRNVRRAVPTFKLPRRGFQRTAVSSTTPIYERT
ncbi:hypothetical protein M9H77_16236 [Catharanthus roseus]|uniref:Uncharacterized protein n=1 Tax=Catharanthus roseus TaxID=4058 RepID=A0ACC0B1A2_CATRO|nr:hypothetical protein M9H77_16236 [Catharanthus roseus]